MHTKTDIFTLLFCNTPIKCNNWKYSIKKSTSIAVSFLIQLQASSRHSFFPVNFVKFLRTPFLQNTSVWLFLSYLLCVLQLVKRCFFIWYITLSIKQQVRQKRFLPVVLLWTIKSNRMTAISHELNKITFPRVEKFAPLILFWC